MLGSLRKCKTILCYALKMREICLLILFLLAGCTTLPMRIDLKIHITEFEKYCNCKVDIPIKITEVEQDKKDDGYRTLAVCYGFRMSKIFRSIEIDEGYWNKATHCERESTVFHELGHCLLDLKHDEEMFSHDFYLFMRPKSVMHPYAFPQYCSYRDQYIKELFNKKK